MNKRFLTAMLGMGLVLGMAALVLTGCETETSVSALNKGRTIVLTGVPAGISVRTALVFDANAVIDTSDKANAASPVGVGSVVTSDDEVTINVQPNSGSFSADTYQVMIADASGARWYTKVGVSLKTSKVSIDWTQTQMTLIQETSYGISLSESGEYQFAPAEPGYKDEDIPPALSVTVTNTGNQATGELTVTISDNDLDNDPDTAFFTLNNQNESSIKVTSIDVDKTAAFSVRPKGGLDAGVYDAKVTVTGRNSIQEEFTVRFTVTKPEEKPMYGISLSRNGEHNFGTVYEDYELPAVLSVNVTNTGTQATGELTVSISPSGSFTLSTDTIDSIAPNASTAFSVRPNSGLPEDVYRATVTVSGSNIIPASFTVKFEVATTPTPAPPPEEEQKLMYDISLSESGDYNFTSVVPGYENPPAALSVTIENTGKEPTGPLTVSISDNDLDNNPNTASFTLSTQPITNIAVGAKIEAFSVQPTTKLPVGVHIATITVTGANNIFAVLTVSFTVKPPTKVATVPSQVTWDDLIVTVTYMGTAPLTGITVPANKTLVITGTIEGQAAEIKKANAATSTVTNNGTIKTATTAKNVLANLVGISTTSNGKVVLTGAVTDVTAPLALGADLDIGAGGSITYTGNGTAAFSGVKKVTITGTGKLDLGSNITTLGATITNNGTAADAITTATAALTTLKNILAVGGNITASGGEITVTGSDTTIKADSTLTITNTGTLAIASTATLKVIGTLALADTGTLDNKGTIEVPTATKLAEVLELNDRLNGKVTVNKTDVTLLSDAIVLSGVELLVPSEQTLRVSEVTLTVKGKLTVNGKLTGDGNLVVEDGRVVVGATGDVTVTGSSSSGLIDVTAKYSLPTHTEIDTSVSATANKNLQGITRTAEKNLVNGDVTIYLGGTVTANETLVTTWFGAKGNDAPDGKYAIATIDGIITDAAKATGTVVKNTNPSWQWYTGASHNFIVTDKPEAATTDKHIWLGDSTKTAFNWRKYGALPNNEFTVILWSEAEPPQAELVITPVGGTAYTVIVNWDGLDIN